jgi:hypothetical protein
VRPKNKHRIPLYSQGLLCVGHQTDQGATVVRLVRLKHGFDKIKASWEEIIENHGAGVVSSVMADSCVSFILVYNALSTIIIILILLIIFFTLWSFTFMLHIWNYVGISRLSVCMCVWWRWSNSCDGFCIVIQKYLSMFAELHVLHIFNVWLIFGAFETRCNSVPVCFAVCPDATRHEPLSGF